MKILLLEDHPIFRIGVRTLIEKHWPGAHCAEAGQLSEAMTLAQRDDWPIAIVDLHLPDAEGMEIVTSLLRIAPSMRVLVLSQDAEAAYAQRVFQLGAMAYLSKERTSTELVEALERVSRGGRYITQTLAEHFADLISGQRQEALHEGLSAQEYSVLIQLAQGHRLAQIAEHMHISPKTVSTYRTRVLEKLNLTSNAQLVRYCLEHRLLASAGNGNS